MIYVIDYGAGNIMSVMNALKSVGASAALTSDPSDLKKAEGVILPGVGNFGAAMHSLNANGMSKAIIEAAQSGKQILGICLGLQLFLESSEESPDVKGLALIRGEVTKLKCGSMKLPHIGWTSVEQTKGIMEGSDNDFFYFVHSYAAHSDSRAASATYGETFDAVVEKDNVCAFQFHPEKSGKSGIKLIGDFVGRVKGER